MFECAATALLKFGGVEGGHSELNLGMLKLSL